MTHRHHWSSKSYLCLGPGFSSAGNTPFRRHKTWVHEGGISTPLIAHWPKDKSERSNPSPLHVIDIVPTILEMAGIPKPSSWKNQKFPPLPAKAWFLHLHPITIQRDHLWWFHDGHRAVQGRFQTSLRKKRTLGIIQFENGPGRVQKPRESKTKTKRKMENLGMSRSKSSKKLFRTNPEIFHLSLFNNEK